MVERTIEDRLREEFIKIQCPFLAERRPSEKSDASWYEKSYPSLNLRLYVTEWCIRLLFGFLLVINSECIKLSY